MSEPSRGARRRNRRFDSLAQEAYLNLWRSYDRLRVLEDELFAQYDLTAQQYNALRLLRGGHPHRMATLALAASLVSKAPDITRLVDKLVERGLVDRERPVSNRRTVQVGLTAAGMALLASLDGPVRDCHERQLGHLSREDQRRLVDLLQASRRPHEEAGSPWRQSAGPA